MIKGLVRKYLTLTGKIGKWENSPNNSLKGLTNQLSLRDATIRENEARFREILEQSAHASYKRIIGRNRYEYLSPVFTEITGYSVEHMNSIGELEYMELIHPEDVTYAKYIYDNLANLVSDTRYTVEYRFKLPDGSYKWLMDRLIIQKDPDTGEHSYIGTITDISSRKEVEERLKESESQKRDILDGIPLNIALVDSQLNMLWANKTAVESAKSTLGEMVGKPCYAFWGDTKAPCFSCPTVLAFETKTAQHKMMQTPDGRIWDESGHPIFDGKGNITSVVEVAVDVTDFLNRYSQYKSVSPSNQFQKCVVDCSIGCQYQHACREVKGMLPDERKN